MNRPTKDLLGYIHCQGENCNRESKKSKGFVWFKGKLLCIHCRRKASKSLNYLPKLNPKESSLNKLIKLPREKVKTKVEKVVDNKFSVCITKDEYNFMKRHLIKEGLTGFEAHKKIGELIEIIKLNHKKYKKKEINFQEEFSKLM